MTREDKLYTMKMADLANVAEKLGIKINKKAAKSEAIEKILAAENANKKELITDVNEVTEITNPDDIDDDTYTELIMQQKKELGIECPKIEDYEIIVPEAKDKKLATELAAIIDPVILKKFTKREQSIIIKAYKDEAGYHVTASKDGVEKLIEDVNLFRIGLAVRQMYKGE